MTPTDEHIMECIRKGIDTAPEMTADHLNLPVIPIYLNAVDYETDCCVGNTIGNYRCLRNTAR